MTANSMMTSIRNNLNLLSNRDRLKNRLGGYNSKNKTEYNLPKASTKQLKAIRKKLREEQKIRMVKVVVLSAILFFGLICLFVYSTDEIIELLTY